MSTTQKLLFAAHLRAAKRVGLEFGNLGWVVTETAYLSKTNAGVFETRRVCKGKYVHVFK